MGGLSAKALLEWYAACVPGSLRGSAPRARANMASECSEHRTDRSLVGAALRGDPSAQEDLLARLECIPAMLRMRNRRLGGALDEALLQDLAQDVILAVWSRLETYSGAAPLEAWVYRFCTNKHFALVRDRGLHASIETAATDDPVATPSTDSAWDTERLEGALQTLEPAVADILRRRHFEDESFEQIGSTSGISPATAKTRYYRALKRLREVLSRQGTG